MPLTRVYGFPYIGAMDENTWQERIEWALAAGWSRRKLADEIGVEYSSFCDLARGLTKQPNGYAAVRLFQITEPLHPEAAA